uniref:Uncharacterized protein n=1 Tax=Phytophthora ramorum TaxID=164328 RepID=H3GZK1_PHYRM
MEQIMQMQDDIHKLKKLMDSVFDKILGSFAARYALCEAEKWRFNWCINVLSLDDSENQSEQHSYDTADAYADKDRIVEMLNRLSSRMADADMSNLTATPTKDATPEDITELKQNINRIEAERQNINRRAGASLKGVL